MIRYVNFHILQTLPFSNPNRDDTGAPKAMTFGAQLRGRMSSQAGKRASRIAFEAGSAADLTSRSKYADDHLIGAVARILADKGVALTDDQKAKLNDSIEKEIKTLTGKADGAKDTLVWIAEAEINGLAAALTTKAADDANITLTKADIDAVLSAQTDSLSIAAFGRMFANRADLQIDAALQVGHAMTTHAQQTDLDYFTAYDDLQKSFDTPDEDGNVKGAGAGHLDVNEFHSGVFYRYFNINRDDLATNWTPLGTNPTDDTTSDRLAAFLAAMLLELPTGRDATAAHQTFPDHIMVTFGTRGTTYAPAFEKPVAATADGYMAPSIEALTSYADKVTRVYGDDHRIVLDLNDANSITLADLYTAVTSWITTGALPNPTLPDATQDS